MENSCSLRRHRTPAERAEILVEYHQSGLTQKVFAAQKGLGCSTLSLWLRRATAAPDGRRPEFVALPNLLSARPASAAYRLQWSDGFTLEVGAGFAASELSTLLQVVRRL